MREVDNGLRPGACPDPGLVAAHADGHLSGEEAARMDAHLASCQTCGEVFAETLRFALEQAEEAPPRRAVLPLFRRHLYPVAAGLAAAAALILAIRPVWRGNPNRLAQPIVAELATALGEQRFIEPRLTGGFRHGRLVLLRGEEARGLDAYPPAVLGAVARIRERAQADRSPETLGALGVTYLLSGDIPAAVKALESAAAQAPRNASLLSDLAAAYLVKASRLDEPADVPKALEAAEKAIALDSPPPEAYFNRALALESLHLVEAARKAWQDYLSRDAASGWTDEARRHLEALEPARQSSVEEDRARVREALHEGAGAVNRLAEAAPSLLRDYFQDELLPSWAAAYLAGQPETTILVGYARLIGDALLERTSDALPVDTARALTLGASPGHAADPVRVQALGFQAFREAMRLNGAQQPSCGQFREARRRLEAGGSPYTTRVRERVVVACLYPGEPEAALAELRRIERDAEVHGYAHVLGLARYLQGLFLSHRGSLTTSLERYGLARAAFRAVGDTERVSLASATIAETFQMLGESDRAWTARRQALALLGQIRDPGHRHGILEEAALACLDERLLRSALDFQTAVVESARAWSNAVAMSDALIRRGGIRGRLRSSDAAAADLAAARSWIPRIADGPAAERAAAEADAVEGELLVDREPDRASALLSRTLSYFERNSPVRVPGARLLLARAQAARGLDDETEEQLEAGIEALESERASLGDAALQTSFFDQSAPLFDDMVRLQLDRRHDPERALLFVERGRARQLADSLATPLGSRGQAVARGIGQPLEPETLQRELPLGISLVYYVSREDRLLAWVLDRDGCRFLEIPWSADELQRLIAAHAAALERRADLAAVRELAARLYDALVRPLASALHPQRALVFVPDGALQAVAFGGLYDRETGRYLVEDHLVELAPSGTVFLHASAAAAAVSLGGAPAVLAVGNPRVDRDLGRGLPNLPGAEAEAREVARLYRRDDRRVPAGYVEEPGSPFRRARGERRRPVDRTPSPRSRSREGRSRCTVPPRAGW
jgi:tetratricopeptide (TPR) repeat protein